MAAFIGSTAPFNGHQETLASTGHKVIYKAYAGESPILSGGKPVTNWQPDKNGRWKAPSPIADFRQLYVNGVRAERAKGKAPENLKLDGKDGYSTTDVAMADWKNPSDIELCYQVIWAHTRCKVQSIKRKDNLAIITMLQPYFSQAKSKEGVNVADTFDPKLDSIYLENAIELLDEPGEWYLDRTAKTVYYMPRPGEDMTKAEVTVPALEKIAELTGTLDAPVQNIQFQGLTFEYGSWLRPSEIGFVDVQANFVLDWNRPQRREGGIFTAHNQHIKSPANIVCRIAHSIRFERCTFTKMGSAAIDLELGCQDNSIIGCRFFDISGNAVQISDVLLDYHHPDDIRKIVKTNSVVNNYIHNCGTDYRGSVGVFAGYTEGTVIAHNEICNLPYSGISVGWGWGEEDAGGGPPNYYQPYKFATPTPAKNNRIEFNHIHNVMSKADDGAGIYTLGNQPGSIIQGNYIHDCKNPTSKRGWAQGIYLDEGSGFIEVTGNLVHGLKPIHYNNQAQDRKATCNEHDNLFDTEPTKASKAVEKAGLEADYRDLLKAP